MSEFESAIDVLVSAMINSKADNYNQHIVSGDNGIDYVVTVQVKNGLTPCQKLAKIEAQSEWVSVKDRLPPEDGFVIARSIGGASLDSKYSTGTSVLYFSRLMEEGHEFQSQHRASHVTATHWMPLPEPPKQ